MPSPFACLVTFLVTSVSLCSGQSVCKPPSDEKCVCNCNPVVTYGNDNALKSELEQLKVAIIELSQTREDSSKGNKNDTEADKPLDCQDILDNDETTPSGVYMVYPRDNLGGFLVFCDMDTDSSNEVVCRRFTDAHSCALRVLSLLTVT
ncbi:uncharacterized protein LOC118410570 [Branchiostoma floridae]|uniref:Uncharacterized protein LOC118410570 n=1 Tax=Branchiostoma floridae TaxID=7739 RepID=A0A9J7KQA9_BRAFL|nr:uncharacterized protein LOC118410570 [Branchiostoma floridae]